VAEGMDRLKIFKFTHVDGRLSWPWVFALLVVALLLALQLIDDKFSYLKGTDNAHYILLAKAAAEGHGYTDIHIPGHPPHTQYPPVLPFLLSPVFYLLGYNFVWMHLLMVLFGVATVYIVMKLFERDMPFAVILALMVVTNRYVLFFMGEILTEVPYMFLSLAAVYLLGKYCEESSSKPYAVLVPLIVATAYLTRMVGVTIYAAALTVLLVKVYGSRDEGRLYVKKLAFLGVLGILPLVIWSVRSSLYSEGTLTYLSIFSQADYYDQERGPITFGFMLARLKGNIELYIGALPGTLITFFDYFDRRKMVNPFLLKSFGFLIFITFSGGLFYRLYYKRSVKDFYVLFYLLTLLAWPVAGLVDARRYLVPLVPLLYYHFLSGISLFTGIKGPRAPENLFGLKRSILIPCGIILILNCMENGRMVRSPFIPGNVRTSMNLLSTNLFKRVERVELDVVTTEYFRKEVSCYHQYLESASLLGEISDPGEVIMTRKPEVVSLITERYAVNFPYSADREAMMKFMEDNGVNYILLDGCYEETGKYLIPFLQENTDRFSVWMHDDGYTGILKFIRK
jgi:hypothetical protein